MTHLGKASTGQFCWVDMAATDADSAKALYGQMFGWTSREQPANGGSFARLRISDQDVCSIYQLRHVHLDRGVPSHWTPDTRVDNVNDAVWRSITFGGELICSPLHRARRRTDCAHLGFGRRTGLWEPMRADMGQSAHG